MQTACDRGRKGDNRVIRGGSWNNNARNCRAAYRNANDPRNANDNVGFRLVRAHEPAGWPAPDQTPIASRPRGPGKPQMGPGVEVAAADAPSNPRREPAYPSREIA